MNSAEQIQEEVPTGWRFYLDVGIRRRWWLAIPAIIFWAAGLTLSLVLSAKYKSETLVLIGQEGAPAEYVMPNVSDFQQRLQSLTEQTLSRPRLVQLIKQFHLYGYTPGQIVSDDAVKAMRADISVELTRSNDRGNISAFKIAYSASSPEQAQKITASLASLFMQDSLASQQQLAEQTTSFLESQLQDARKELEKQDNLMHDFKSRNQGDLPEQRATNAQILSGLEERLQSARESLNQADKQQLYLGSLLGWSVDPKGNATAAGDASVPTSTSLDEEIDERKAELADLSAHYTQRYPDIVHLKERIASAEKLKREMASNAGATRAAGAPGTSRSQPAVSQVSQLQSEFKANELEITNRKKEIRHLEDQISQYQARLNLTPTTEQQLAELTRNDDQARAHYESLLAKKQQSAMATDLSKTQQSQIFQQVDPPTLPQKPYWPNRLKLSGMGLLLGILAGLLAITVKETVDARIYSEDDLIRWVAVPVIATVPPLITSAEENNRLRRRRLEIAIASALVMLVPALTLVAYLNG
ncbi:MAG TPA: Wzz/FepE/Etk N-terminal domain-containing protein [Candidatus Angelobacter sp.]|nr:Wzz/FepE/Etk N-terminal domain-containing protein [Candidatus Angelobacter sp.]